MLFSLSCTSFAFRRSISPRLFLRAMSQQTNQGMNILNWASKDGEFRRQVSSFRDWLSDDPNAPFPAEPYVESLYA